MVGLFFFNDAATTEIYTLSLHDALPICRQCRLQALHLGAQQRQLRRHLRRLSVHEFCDHALTAKKEAPQSPGTTVAFTPTARAERVVVAGVRVGVAEIRGQ